MLRRSAFKKGATSIYVVVISTLLFSVITFSFIRIIISEVAKTTNDELAQAAYDSALAGVEDAKTALKRYYECKQYDDDQKKEGGELEHCRLFESVFEDKENKGKGFHSTDSDTHYCDSIAEVLGRIDTSWSSSDELREVLIQEQTKTGGDRENIVQAYTCVTVDNTLDDYRGTLSASTPVRVIQLKTEDPNSITGVRIFWYSDEDGSFELLNYASGDRENEFHSIGSGNPVPTPPTITAEIIQTAPEFTLESFLNSSPDGRTNRGTVVLTPTVPNKIANAPTHIKAGELVKSNNHDYGRSEEDLNKAQKIGCIPRLLDEFACGASIEIPEPVGSKERNGKTFFLVLALPYGNPTTSFAVQLCNDKESGGVRGDCKVDNSTSVAQFKDVQIAVDATGRANDMYSRVEARIEFKDNFVFPQFAIYASGDNDDSLKKNFFVTKNCVDTTDPYNIKDCDNTTRDTD